jgi:glutamine amidotransferase
MCRLFGVIANNEVDVKFSMLYAQKSFKELGEKNCDGWGIGWYEENTTPRIEKKGESAFFSSNFNNIVKTVSSKIVIAHVRYATNGSSSAKNAHPFLYRNYIFAHNGTINKKRVKEMLKIPFNKKFTSEHIDSEIYFRFIIQCISENNDDIKGIEKAIQDVTNDSNGANFILSEGNKLIGFKCGRPLFYLSRKPGDKLKAKSNETKADISGIKQEKAILICSEKLTSNENWEEVNERNLIIINRNLSMEKFNI